MLQNGCHDVLYQTHSIVSRESLKISFPKFVTSELHVPCLWVKKNSSELVSAILI